MYQSRRLSWHFKKVHSFQKYVYDFLKCKTIISYNSKIFLCHLKNITHLYLHDFKKIMKNARIILKTSFVPLKKWSMWFFKMSNIENKLFMIYSKNVQYVSKKYSLFIREMLSMYKKCSVCIKKCTTIFKKLTYIWKKKKWKQKKTERKINETT